MDKFGRTVYGFAEKGVKLLRHYGTKVNRHCEGFSPKQSFLKGTKLLRHYGTKSNCHAELVSASVRGEIPKQVRNDNMFVQSDKTFVQHDKGVLKKCAFTLSEVLIVLAVLGVVAAMTIPDLVQDYQKKATATALKKVYSNLNQVVIASAADNGSVLDFFTVHSTVDPDIAKKYFETYWFPYFRVQKVADNNKTFYDSITPYRYMSKGDYPLVVFTFYTTARFLFSDVSGMIYLINRPNSATQTIHVDLNGIKAPNTLGKDVFCFIFDINEGTVDPCGYSGTKASINRECSNTGYTCAAKIKRDGWKIADDYPW